MKRAAASLLLASFAAGAFADADVVDDWAYGSTAVNGDWSYGYTNTLGSAFNLYDLKEGNEFWTASAIVSAGAPAAGLNQGPPLNGINTGEFLLHGGPNNQLSVARWTAPTNLDIHITGTFGVGDSGKVDVHVLKNSASQFSVFDTASAQSFYLTLSVLAGDTIDFAVGTTDAFFFDSTPLSAHITAVPEPATMVVLGLGGLALLRRRRKS